MIKKNIWEKLEKILIYAFLTYIVFMGIIPFKFLDELITILLIGIHIVKNKKLVIDKKKIILLLIYILITFLTVLIRKYYLEAYIMDLIYTLKPFILLEAISCTNISDKNLNKYIRFLITINTFSIVYAFYNYYLASKGIYIEGGLYRNWVYRPDGFSGHPANLANICMISIAYLFQNIQNIKSKKSKLYILIIVLNLSCIYFTLARLQLFIIIIYVMYFIYQKINKTSIKIMVFLLLAGSCIFTLMDYKKILNNYTNDIDNAIRFQAIKKVPEVLNKYPLLGTGVGSFSTKESIELNSYVYNEFNFSNIIIETAKKSSMSLFESNMAKQLIQTGILGTLLYYSYFFMLYKKIRNNDRKSINAKFWLIFIVISSALNVIYDVQLLVPLALLIANINTKTEEK